jgi:hypothetical protein
VVLHDGQQGGAAWGLADKRFVDVEQKPQKIAMENLN